MHHTMCGVANVHGECQRFSRAKHFLTHVLSFTLCANPNMCKMTDDKCAPLNVGLLPLNSLECAVTNGITTRNCACDGPISQWSIDESQVHVSIAVQNGQRACTNPATMHSARV